MSIEYDLYLEQHKENVAKGFKWIQEYLPELIVDIPGVDYEHQICFAHDDSKTMADEYDAYDAYYYTKKDARSYAVMEAYKKAWLTHLHRNPHHWQHWILINDEPGEGEIIMDMPYNYILEMISDWWAFSHSKGELREIFHWYNEHKNYMKLSDKTRAYVNLILTKIRMKLDELESGK